MSQIAQKLDDPNLTPAYREHIKARWRDMSNDVNVWRGDITMNKVAARDKAFLEARIAKTQELLNDMDFLLAGKVGTGRVGQRGDTYYDAQTGEVLSRPDLENTLRRLSDDLELIRNTPPEGRAPRDARFLTRLWSLSLIKDGVDKNGVRLEEKLRNKLRDRFRESPYVNGRRVSSDPADIEARVDEAMAAIRKESAGTGRVDGFAPGNTVTRKIDLTNRELLEFIETDMRVLMSAYESRMAPAIEMKRRYGDADMAHELWRTRQDMLEQIDERMAAGDWAGARALQAEMVKTTEALEIARDKALNLFGIVDDPTSWDVRAINFAKNYAIMTLMGRAWQAAIPDIGRTLLVSGFTDFFKTLSLRIKSPDAFKLASREAKLAGEAMETALNIRAMLLSEQQGGVYKGSRVERAAQQGAGAMFVLNLLNPWTDFWKSFSGAIISNNIIEASMRVAEGKPKAQSFGSGRGDLELLREVGITDEMATKIAKQYADAGSAKLEHLLLANTEAWTDLEVARTFRAAVGQEVRNVIITPGPSDKPNFMSKPLWGMIFQFKAFPISAAQRISMSGLQRPDKRFLSSIMAMITGGFMVEHLRGGNFPVPIEERLARAVDYSGVLALFTDINNQIEIASDGQYGLRALLGLEPIIKDPSVMQQVTSPFGPTVSQAGRLVSAITDPDPHKTGSALRSVIPFAGWWPIYPLTQGLQAQASDAIAEN